MSTELQTIKGRQELPDKVKKASNYDLTEMTLTAFSGPQTVGRMLQITVGNYPFLEHIQIDAIEARKLIEELTKFINGTY